jgi:thiol-disulfide isomerase/thioredoxin
MFKTKYEEIPPDLNPLTPPVVISDSTWGWKLYDVYGNQYLLSEVKHYTIFLNIWETWCEPCLVELPGLQRMYDSLKTEGIELFFVTEENAEIVRRFVEEKKYTLPVFLSRDGVPNQLRTGAYPTTYVIDSKGRIVFKEMRSAKWDHPSVLAALRKVNEERRHEQDKKER